MTVDDYAIALSFASDSEALHAAHRAGTICAGREVLDGRRALRDRAKHCITMRNGLVAGKVNRSRNALCWRNGASGHQVSTIKEAGLWRQDYAKALASAVASFRMSFGTSLMAMLNSNIGVSLPRPQRLT